MSQYPTPYPGETHLQTLLHTTFRLSPTPLSFSPLHGTATLHLSTYRLTLTPLNQAPITLPLLWFLPQTIRHSTPFFDAPHLAAELLPDAVPLLRRVGVWAGGSIWLRVEGVGVEEVVTELREVVADGERVRRDARIMRGEIEKGLVKTDVHFAFVDPSCPNWLFLCTQLRQPHQPF